MFLTTTHKTENKTNRILNSNFYVFLCKKIIQSFIQILTVAGRPFALYGTHILNKTSLLQNYILKKYFDISYVEQGCLRVRKVRKNYNIAKVKKIQGKKGFRKKQKIFKNFRFFCLNLQNFLFSKVFNWLKNCQKSY